MPRAKYIQIVALSLMLVIELSDWRWLQPDDGPDRNLFALNSSQVLPTGLLARTKLQERIEAPPAGYALPSAQLVGLARPDHFVIDVTNEPFIAQLTEADPVYGFMSIQC